MRKIGVTFGADHYVPVLKVKRGEKKALQTIAAPLRSRITPLLEIVERNPDRASTIDRHLDTAFKDLASAVGAYRRCLLDTREVEPDGPSAATAVFRRAAREGITFTPVTGLSRTADVAAALRHRDNGIAVRLTREEFERGTLANDINAFMTKHGLRHREVDVIVDLGAVDDLVRDGVATFAAEFLAEVPDQTEWRTLTISACAFPASMGGVERNSHSRVERSEWKVWRDESHANRQNLARLPSYSDCAIQHPKGVEGFDPRTMQVSAAVRYTRPEDWLLIKGESTRNTPPSEQFPDLATQLVYGHLRRDFSGASHCPGCAAMKAAADGAGGFGSAEAWRRLGTIHHITSVVEGLAALPWP
jgi:hypothetical protein